MDRLFSAMATSYRTRPYPEKVRKLPGYCAGFPAQHFYGCAGMEHSRFLEAGAARNSLRFALATCVVGRLHAGAFHSEDVLRPSATYSYRSPRDRKTHYAGLRADAAPRSPSIPASLGINIHDFESWKFFLTARPPREVIVRARIADHFRRSPLSPSKSSILVLRKRSVRSPLRRRGGGGGAAEIELWASVPTAHVRFHVHHPAKFWRTTRQDRAEELGG